MLVCAPILKINKKIISDSSSPWNYFYKTMVLILRQFLNIKTMVLYSDGSINRESPVHAEGLNTLLAAWCGVTCTNPPWCNMHKPTIHPIPLQLSKINCSTPRSLCHKISMHRTGLPLVLTKGDKC